MNTIISEDNDSPRSLAEIGMSEQEIANHLKLSLKRLQKKFKHELREGAAEGNRQVLKALHDAARSGSNMAATALWVKARCGWRDTGAVPQSGKIIRSQVIFGLRSPSTTPPDTTLPCTPITS